MIFGYAKEENISEIMELYEKAKATPGCTWNEDYPNIDICRNDIVNNNILCLFHDNQIIAAVSYDMDEVVDQLEIWNRNLGATRELARLVVKDEYRNMGIARRMILKSMEELKKRGYKAIHYLVSPDNEKAVRSYEKLDFCFAGECEYAGHHWLAYEKSLYSIENSITIEFKNRIWKSLIKGIEKYNLIKDGDSIAVCVSGGKDSFLLAKLMKMLADYKYKIDVKYIMLDPGYSSETLQNVKYNADLLGIELEIFKTSIFNDTAEIRKNPCFFCSRMRRGQLYRKAKELGCNKIALGHHYDDVVETILMGMLYGAQVQTMLPIIKSDNVDNMKLIRPMYLIKEDAISDWQEYNKMEFVRCACSFFSNNGEEDTTRLKVKKLIRNLTNENSHVKDNIFGSVQNVDLNKIMSYKLEDTIYSSWDDI